MMVAALGPHAGGHTGYPAWWANAEGAAVSARDTAESRPTHPLHTRHGAEGGWE